MSGTSESVPFEVYEPGVYLHGTKAELAVGELLVPGRESNYEAGDGRGHIYLVEPTGEFEDDPNVTDKKFPGNPTQSFRSRKPLRVVSELIDWVGHPPEKLQAMRYRIDGLKQQGRTQIED